MRRILCAPLPKLGQKTEIESTEAKHLTTVLRIQDGEKIELLDGQGLRVHAKIIIEGKRVFAEALSAAESNPQLNALPVQLKIAILKGEAMEWVIEKAVELGVRTLVPLHTDYTVVQIQKKGADAFIERWQKIADQALKQCGRLEKLIIAAPQKIEDTLINESGLTLWLDEATAGSGAPHLLDALHEALPRVQSFSLLIGPEGGFSPSERERLLQLTALHKQEIKRVQLGAIILRAETAALMGASLLVGTLNQKLRARL